MSRKLYLLSVLLIFKTGCPTTCVVQPNLDDELTRADSFRMTGLLLDVVEESSEPLPDTTMPCNYSYYGETHEDYLGGGVVDLGCDLRSGTAGIFSADFEMSLPGLYRFYFEPPLIDTRHHLVTSRPDLHSSSDQWIYLDWDYEGDITGPHFEDFFLQTLDLSRFDDPEEMAAVGVEMAKIEIERVIQEYFHGLRIYFWEPSRSGETPGADVQIVQIESCGGGTTEEDCALYPAGSGTIDYLNDNLVDGFEDDFPAYTDSETPCHIYLSSIIDLVSIYSRNFFFSPEESLSTRATDIARRIAGTASHEIGHSLGLVDYRLFSSYPTDFQIRRAGSRYGIGHTPMEPPFVAAVRYIPKEIMSNRGGGFGGDLDDCSSRSRESRDLDEPIERCPSRWNLFNHQYLREILSW